MAVKVWGRFIVESQCVWVTVVTKPLFIEIFAFFKFFACFSFWQTNDNLKNLEWLKSLAGSFLQVIWNRQGCQSRLDGGSIRFC